MRRTLIAILLSLLLLGCAKVRITVSENGTIDYSYWHLGGDNLGLSWTSEAADGGGRHVDASMHAIVFPEGESASQNTLRQGLITGGGLGGDYLVGNVPGAMVGAAATQMDWSRLPGIGLSEEEVREDERRRIIQHLVESGYSGRGI